MYTFLNILLFLALGATVVTLVVGIYAMLKARKDGNQEQSNKLMRLRVIFQAIALVIIAILLATRHG